MLPLTNDNIRLAILHNVATLKRDLPTKGYNMQHYYWLSETGHCIYEPGQAPITVNRMSDDMVAATVVESLPFCSQNGVDAIKLHGEERRNIEVKLAYKSKSIYGMAPTGKTGLYQGDPSDPASRCSLRSSVSGSYEIANNLSKKGVDTYLVLVDADGGKIVEVGVIEGSKIISILSVNGTTGKLKSSRKRDIKLSTFLTKGQAYRNESFDMCGIRAWEDAIRKPILLKKELAHIEVQERFHMSRREDWLKQGFIDSDGNVLDNSMLSMYRYNEAGLMMAVSRKNAVTEQLEMLRL